MGRDALFAPLVKLSERMKANKRLELLVYGSLVAAGVLLFFLGGTGEKSAGEAAPVQSAVAADDTEARLEQTLSCIRGAGKVEVMITYDSGTQIVPAMSTDVQSSVSQNSGSLSENRTESSKPATLSGSGGSEPIVLTEKTPTVRGVIVIAEGAADLSVRLKLQAAVQTVLGVEAKCIEVFEMRAQESNRN